MGWVEALVGILYVETLTIINDDSSFNFRLMILMSFWFNFEVYLKLLIPSLPWKYLLLQNHFF